MIWYWYLNWPLRRSSINDPILLQGDSEIVPKQGVVVGGKCQVSGYLTSQAFNLTLRVSFLYSPKPILKRYQSALKEKFTLNNCSAFKDAKVKFSLYSPGKVQSSLHIEYTIAYMENSKTAFIDQ